MKHRRNSGSVEDCRQKCRDNVYCKVNELFSSDRLFVARVTFPIEQSWNWKIEKERCELNYKEWKWDDLSDDGSDNNRWENLRVSGPAYCSDNTSS